MKKILIIATLAILFGACEEEAVNPMDFKITGVRDTLLEQGQAITLPLSVFYLGGEREAVRLVTENLPNGTSIRYTPGSGEPDYSLNQIIEVAANADTGTFSLSVKGISESGKVFERNFVLIVEKEGNDAPQIVLNGSNPLTHPLNSTFFDPGYTAFDVEEGNLTSLVQVSGVVNKDSVGIYNLSYTVSDSQGASATATRMVKVLNDLNYVNGQYSCITFVNGVPPASWITSVSASANFNNRFQIFKLSDLLGADVWLDYDPATGDINLPLQTFSCGNPAQPHTFTGTGDLNYNGVTVTIEVLYTDTYFDSTLNQTVTINKRDLLNK